MNTTDINLDDLPVPNIVEEVDYEQLLLERKKKLTELNPDYKEAMELESDPLLTDLQVGAYREYILRHRINEAAQARLLAKARAGDLDHLGDFYGVKRDEGEADDDYRLRIRDRIIGSSTAGSAAHYRTRAMEINPSGIRDIAIDSPRGGEVRVSILVRTGYCFKREALLEQLGEFDCSDYCTENDELGQRENNTCPDFNALSEALIAQVRHHVTSDSVRMLTDTVNVVPSEKVVVDVHAGICLQPTTPEVIFDKIKTDFLVNWEKEAKLGWDITPSWIAGQLHHAGVHHVDISTPDMIVSIAPNQSVVPGTIEILLTGKDY